jgi:hypothetical protein
MAVPTPISGGSPEPLRCDPTLGNQSSNVPKRISHSRAPRHVVLIEARSLPDDRPTHRIGGKRPLSEGSERLVWDAVKSAPIRSSGE